MDNEMQKTLHIGMDLISVVALVTLVAIILTLARMGWTQYQSVTNIADTIKNKEEFEKYDRDLSADEVINFMITYGEQYKYMLTGRGAVIVSENTTEAIKANVKKKVLTSSNYSTSEYIPLISSDLIEFFRTGIVKRYKYKIRAITYEGIEMSLREAGSCEVIIIEEKGK